MLAHAFLTVITAEQTPLTLHRPLYAFWAFTLIAVGVGVIWALRG